MKTPICSHCDRILQTPNSRAAHPWYCGIAVTPILLDKEERLGQHIQWLVSIISKLREEDAKA